MSMPSLADSTMDLLRFSKASFDIKFLKLPSIVDKLAMVIAPVSDFTLWMNEIVPY